MKAGVLRKKENPYKGRNKYTSLFPKDKLKPSQAEVGINKENIEKGEEWNVGFFQIGRIEQNLSISSIINVTC